MPKSVQIHITYKDGKETKILFNEERLIGDCSSYNLGGFSCNISQSEATKKEIDAALAYVYITSENRWVKLIGTHSINRTSTGNFFDAIEAEKIHVPNWVGENTFCISISTILPKMKIKLPRVEKIECIANNKKTLVYS